MEIIAVINQKGGVGKSTTALALGAGLSLKGFKVLFVDIDAQGNLTYTLKIDEISPISENSYDIFTKDKITLKNAIQSAKQGDVITSSPYLAGIDATLSSASRKEYRLKTALETLKTDYDYIIIDTPPSLGILTINALIACTGVIIPAQADIYSLQGISQLYKTIEAVKTHRNPSLKVLGILLTRYSNRSIISRDMAEMMQETATQLGTKLYSTKIREATAIKEAQVRRKSIFEHAPKSKVAKDYADFINEVVGKE